MLNFNNSSENAAVSNGNKPDTCFNYVVDNNVFLFDTIYPATTTAVIGEMARLIKIAATPQNNYSQGEDKNSKPQPGFVTPVSPFDQNVNLKLIDITINSTGGNTYQHLAFAHLINLAKHNNIIVRTNVTGLAASCASLIAIQGTPEYRIMNEYSQHMVHFGKASPAVTKDSEIEKSIKEIKKHKNLIRQPYLQHTKITQKELSKLMKDEMGFLTAQECLRLGFCDYVLTSNGYLER